MSTPTIGTVARFDLESGDSYTGEVVAITGGQVTMQNYSAWYADEPLPIDSAYADDLVSFATTTKTRVTAF